VIEPRFAGCHGVRLEPASQGAAFGTTTGSPLATLAIGDGPEPGAVALAGSTALWRAETAAPDGRPVANAMWRTPDGALVTVIDERPVLWMSGARDATTVAPLGDALLLQLVSTFAAPLAAQRAGALVLHAAAAVRDGRAVVVCAHSGTGKSSVMTALADAGWQPLTEDLLAIEVDATGAPRAWPGPPWVRLAPGLPGPVGAEERFRVTDKVAWGLEGHCDAPAPIAHLVVLEPPSSEPSVCEPMDAGPAVAAIAPHAPWYEDPDERGPALFGHAVALTRGVPVSRLRLRRSPDWRADAVARLEALAG
jgi:hypothetical protein